MRDVFPEFYHPSAADERRFITEGTVVVDANVLLALYELSVVQRDETLGALEKIGDRLWIPYQVGLEYQRNRLGVIQKQASNYTQLVDLHGARDLPRLTEALSRITVPDDVANEARGHLDGLALRLNKASVDYVAAAKQIQDRHVVTVEQGVNDDPVRKRLDELFAGRVGKRPADDVNEKWISEATRRRNEQIPPGYKDEKKESDVRRAGDYLLWVELLEYAESTVDNGKPFLLVTNDVKEDWYAKSGGEPIGPRPELVREFHASNANGYHQVTLEGMLRLAKKHLSVSIGEATIEKASELSRPDFIHVDSTGQMHVLEAKLYRPRSGAITVRQTSILRLLVDLLMDVYAQMLAEASVIDNEVDRERLARSALRAARLVAETFDTATWTDEDDQRAIARSALRKALVSAHPGWAGAKLPPVVVDVFIDLVRASRQREEPQGEADR